MTNSHPLFVRVVAHLVVHRVCGECSHVQVQSQHSNIFIQGVRHLICHTGITNWIIIKTLPVLAGV